MSSLAKNGKIILLAAALMFAFASIAMFGVKFGTDFKGGTLFQIKLSEAADEGQLSIIQSVISKRIDSFGLKDTSVSKAGRQFLIAKVAETDAKQIEGIERILRTQGKFEVLMDGNVLFTGSDIVQIVTDPANGYRVYKDGEVWRWILPFVLKEDAAERFARSIFHKCTIVGYGEGNKRDYDCEKTYFFIDRPSDSVIIIPNEIYVSDSDLFSQGSLAADIPAQTKIEDILLNAGSPYFIVDGNLSQEQQEKLKKLVKETGKAVVHPSVSNEIKDQLSSFGYDIRQVEEKKDVPWLWTAVGGKAIISLTEGITNMEPYVKDIANAKVFSHLTITGTSSTKESAFEALTALRIILETGSLPISIDEISKEVISPALGAEFLNLAGIMGILALITVSLVLFVRYKKIQITIPIMFTALSEATLVLGISAALGWVLDLAGIAGIIAAIGTGVDDQIVITDELIRKREEVIAGSFLNRIKRAFFIIFAAACTVIATMAPILVFGSGLGFGGKLSGFAVTTILGVLVGILITRPAYSELIKDILEKEQHNKS